jgi:hypothetical protein
VLNLCVKRVGVAEDLTLTGKVFSGFCLWQNSAAIAARLERGGAASKKAFMGQNSLLFGTHALPLLNLLTVVTKVQFL